MVKQSSGNWYRFGLLLLSLIALISCGPVEGPIPATISSTASAPADEAYPPPARVQAPVGAYPAPTEINPNSVLLALDKPLRPGDTVVSGVGPAGLTVFIINITFMGEELGSGVINDDGTFSVAVSPLPSGVRIGLSADLEAAGLSADAIRPGDEAISVPQVGDFYDSFVILQN